MNAPRTLRGRLIAAMLAMFVLALAASALLDAPGARMPPRLLDAEPFQDALVLAGFGAPALVLSWLINCRETRMPCCAEIREVCWSFLGRK